MLTVARILAMLSIVSAVVFVVIAVGAGCLNLLHLGFEATGVFGGMSFHLAALAGFLAFLIAVIRSRSRPRDRFVEAVLISAVSLLALAIILTTGAC